MLVEDGHRIVRFGDLKWEPRTEDRWPCLTKRQLFDPDRDLTMRIVWYARDAIEPRHVHPGTHAAFVLVGQANVGGQSLGPWDIVYGPGGVPHGPLHYPVGCMLFVMLDGGALHQAVQGEEGVALAKGQPSQTIVESHVPWIEPEGNADGWPCQRKLLLEDTARGYTAMLVRWAPGTTEPRHTHAGTHASLILQGRAVVNGAELGPWDLIYGPGDVPQGPISFPEGCTMAVSFKGSYQHRRIVSAQE